MSLRKKFERWYALTHWNRPDYDLDYDPVLDRYYKESTRIMYVAYRAGYNRHKKETKEN